MRLPRHDSRTQSNALWLAMTISDKNVQVSDTTGDATKNKSLSPKIKINKYDDNNIHH